MTDAATWQPIETAPRDGTRILTYGFAYPCLAKYGKSPILIPANEGCTEPFTMILQWKEVWEYKEVYLGGGVYRKKKELYDAWWKPHEHLFRPTHWMPLPTPPEESA